MNEQDHTLTGSRAVRFEDLVEHELAADPSSDPTQGRLRYLVGGEGAPLVLLHTVRTQAEHFRNLVPLVTGQYRVYALDLPGMGRSEIVPGASYDEPAMRAAVTRLLVSLDLRDVTFIGESMGAVVALTTAADLPDRVRRVIAVNPYDYRSGIKRSGLLARFIISNITAPGVGAVVARQEPRPIMRAILRGGLVEKSALTEEYLSELLESGRRPGYPVVARAVYRNLASLRAARARYRDVAASVHLVYGAADWSRESDRRANRELLPDAQYLTVPDAGHFIALERPDVLARLTEWVDDGVDGA